MPTPTGKPVLIVFQWAELGLGLTVAGSLILSKPNFSPGK